MGSTRLRVLVTATNLDLAGTAEGSCSVKYLELLVHLGHHVRVINGANNLTESPAPWLPGVEVVDLDGPVEHAPDLSWVGRKLGATRAHLTGFGPLERQRRSRWRRSLALEVATFAPDVVVTRAAGLDVTPHLAMIDLDQPVPWVAHLHDPWPLSTFPDPYRRHEGLISTRQEAACRRILGRADVVTFPAARQRDWQLRRSRIDLGDRAVVVPHLGVEGGLVTGLADPWGPDGSATTWAPPSAEGTAPLRLIHAGSLFRQRDPRPLIEALARIIEDVPGPPLPLQLRLVGWIDPKLMSADGWSDLVDPLVACGALELEPGNITYQESIAALESSDVLLTYVVGTPESPQFPAKLADLFSLGRPMLVIGPRASTPADLVGSSSASFVDRDTPGSMERALRSLLVHRRAGTLGALAPSPRQRRLVSAETVGVAVEQALMAARANHWRRRPRGR